jgi:hypothetical protein
MTHTFKLARRAARLRTPLLALLALGFAACDSADQLTSTTPEEPAAPAAVEPTPTPATDGLTVEDSLGATDLSDPTGGLPIYDGDDDSGLEEEEALEESGLEVVQVADEAVAAAPQGLSLASSFRGGIPFGTFHLPKSLYGKYNGSLIVVFPRYLTSYLESARRSGTRVILALSGSERHFKNRDRSFNMERWKARINRYRGINLTSYINDGTIIGHYLIDEPHDPHNWGRKLVSRAQLDAMAKYSKQLWPKMATIVRSWPAYLRGYRYRYLDAAWAQYLDRFGSVNSFMSNNVRDARASGLALVAGVNLLAGGARRGGIRGFYRDRHAMSGSQLKTWGTAILNDSYPCAFISWKFNSKYMSRSDVKSALTYLSNKARGRGSKSCRAR